jgi:hypothetical protein
MVPENACKIMGTCWEHRSQPEGSPVIKAETAGARE